MPVALISPSRLVLVSDWSTAQPIRHACCFSLGLQFLHDLQSETPVAPDTILYSVASLLLSCLCCFYACVSLSPLGAALSHSAALRTRSWCLQKALHGRHVPKHAPPLLTSLVGPVGNSTYVHWCEYWRSASWCRYRPARTSTMPTVYHVIPRRASEMCIRHLKTTIWAWVT